MIPLGVLAARRASGADDGSRAFIGAFPDETDKSVYTYPVPVGAGTKTVIVAGTGRLNATHAFTGVTVGGTPLTIDAHEDYPNQGQGWIGHVTKTTAAIEDIVATYTATLLRAGIAVWTVAGPVSVVGAWDGRSSLSPGSVTFSLPAADHVIAYTTNGGDNPSTWTGATKRFDEPAGTGAFWWHSGADGETENPAVAAVRLGATNSILVGASYNNA